MDKQPTQEQIKEFWEWCLGDRVMIAKNFGGDLAIYSKTEDATQPEGYRLAFIDYGKESIDLNNLFKYAVPKIPKTYGVFLLLENWARKILLYDANPALTLFWTIQREVIHNGR
jgi:hypothetical protein